MNWLLQKLINANQIVFVDSLDQGSKIKSSFAVQYDCPLTYNISFQTALKLVIPPPPGSRRCLIRCTWRSIFLRFVTLQLVHLYGVSEEQSGMMSEAVSSISFHRDTYQVPILAWRIIFLTVSSFSPDPISGFEPFWFDVHLGAWISYAYKTLLFHIDELVWFHPFVYGFDGYGITSSKSRFGFYK